MEKVVTPWRRTLVLIAVLVFGLSAAVTAADFCLPEGTQITRATFSIFVFTPNGQTVYLHPVTAAWDENTVTWNSFGGTYDMGTTIGTFDADAMAWRTVDVTAQVQAWVNGDPNYGFLMMQQDPADGATFISKENSDSYFRPKLEICYLDDTGTEVCQTIQPPLQDTWISELDPDTNYGTNPFLYCGLVNDYQKQDLIQFDICVIPQYSEGTGTPGFWKNHPDAWPVDEITFCTGLTFTKAQAIAIMWLPERGDKSYTMFRAAVAAYLNIASGTDPSCIDDTLNLAMEWICAHPPGSGVRGNSPAWNDGESLYLMMDAYNNGQLCAPHRD